MDISGIAAHFAISKTKVKKRLAYLNLLHPKQNGRWKQGLDVELEITWLENEFDRCYMIFKELGI